MPDELRTKARELAAEFGDSWVCDVCGCSDEQACVDEDGNACVWAAEDLCSFCARYAHRRFALDGELVLPGVRRAGRRPPPSRLRRSRATAGARARARMGRGLRAR